MDDTLAKEATKMITTLKLPFRDQNQALYEKKMTNNMGHVPK